MKFGIIDQLIHERGVMLRGGREADFILRVESISSYSFLAFPEYGLSVSIPIRQRQLFSFYS